VKNLANDTSSKARRQGEKSLENSHPMFCF